LTPCVILVEQLVVPDANAVEIFGRRDNAQLNVTVDRSGGAAAVAFSDLGDATVFPHVRNTFV
jgi:hypothetical protein